MIVAIYGPTASGKTDAAIALAAELGEAEIVSADSMQVYRGLERLTNQPTTAERRGVPHHCLGHVNPHDPYDVVRYAADAHAAIDAIRARGATPIVVGGSGLYLRAALTALDVPPRVPEADRARIRAEVDALGPQAAHDRLAAVDPAAAARIQPNDTRRIVRALELAAVGASLAPAGDDDLWTASMRLPTRLFGLAIPRDVVRARIDARTPRLLDDGGIEEVRHLRADGRPLSHTAERAHGVPDVTALLAGEIDHATCVQRLATRTKQYAKRQDTWLRRLHHAEILDADRPAAAVAGEIAGRVRA